jgi:hypothetical protein
LYYLSFIPEDGKEKLLLTPFGIRCCFSVLKPGADFKNLKDSLLRADISHCWCMNAVDMESVLMRFHKEDISSGHRVGQDGQCLFSETKDHLRAQVIYPEGFPHLTE